MADPNEGFRSNLKYWDGGSSGLSPLEYLRKRKTGLTLDDLLGVKRITEAPALRNYGVYGVTDPKIPGSIFADPKNSPNVDETVAHEAEHSRQHAAPDWLYKNLVDPKANIDPLNEMASKLSGYDTVRAQPHISELMSFLRGKEAVGEVNDSMYSKLPPDARHFVLSNMFLGRDKWLPPGPNGEFQSGKQQPSLLDLLRRKMRAITAY